MSEYTLEMVPSEATFSTILMWIQIHGLAAKLMIERKITKLVSTFGTVVSVDLTDYTRKYLRMVRARVQLAFEQPLVPSIWVR